jgi:hypothetical protein
MIDSTIIPIEVNPLTLGKLSKSAQAEGISIEKKIENILDFWIPVEETFIPFEISNEIRTLKEALGTIARENQDLKDQIFEIGLQKRELEVKSVQKNPDLTAVSEYTKTEFLSENPDYRR